MGNTMPAANVVNIDQMMEIAKACFAEKEPFAVWSSPGIGKSMGLCQVATEVFNPTGDRPVEDYFIDVRASLLDPVDLRGIPKVIDGITHWCPPVFLPLEGQERFDRGCVLFLDELTQAPKSVQSALLQLINDGQIGEAKLHPAVVIVAAGNRVTDGTFSEKLSKAVGTRFATHLELVPDLDKWCKWAIRNNVAPEVIAFNRLRPELHNAFDPKALGNSFPCPRIWAKVSKFVNKLAKDTALPFFSGALGDGPAAEFMSFLRLYGTMPNLDEVLLHPATADVPTDPSVLYAVAGAMARKVTKDNARRAFTYMKRLSVEFQTVWLRDAVQINPDLYRVPEFNEWAIENAELLK